MADDIVGGLFGVNPDMYQQQQQQQVFNRAVALQKLNPFQQAAVGLQEAGYNFGGALGGAMGGVDPQLQRISVLNAISKRIDQSNPESMLQGAKMLADAGFTQEALGLAQYARKANSELALAQQRMKEGRAAATTNELKNATAAADLSGFEKGSPEYIQIIQDELLRLTTKPGKTDSIFANINPSDYTQESVRAFVASKNYGDLVPKAAKADGSISAISPSDYTPASLAAFKLSNNYADLVPKTGKTDKLVAAINPSDYTPASIAAFNISGNYADLVAKASKADKLVGTVNPSDYTPESVAAFNLSNNYSDLVLKPSKADKPERTIANINPENFTSASVAAFAISGNYSDLVLRPEKATETTKANIKEIGVSAKGDAVYLDVNNDEQFIYKLVDGKSVRQPYAGTVDRTTAKVSATANAPAAKQEEEFSKQRGKDQAAALSEASTNARAASQAITSITSMKQLDQTGQLVTGPLANSYVGASNLLASIGLLSKNQVSILTSSQVYDKSAKDLVMQDLGGKLGAQISDADRKFVEDRIPQLTTSAKARTELLDKIEQIQRGKIAYYGKMKAHANKNRNLDDFDFSEVYTVTPPIGSAAASSVKSKADAIIKGNP